MSTTITVLIVIAIALLALAVLARVGRLALIFTAVALIGLLVWYVVEDDLDPGTRDAVVEGADAVREGAGAVRREVVDAVHEGASDLEDGMERIGHDEDEPRRAQPQQQVPEARPEPRQPEEPGAEGR